MKLNLKVYNSNEQLYFFKQTVLIIKRLYEIIHVFFFTTEPLIVKSLVRGPFKYLMIITFKDFI